MNSGDPSFPTQPNQSHQQPYQVLLELLNNGESDAVQRVIARMQILSQDLEEVGEQSLAASTELNLATELTAKNTILHWTAELTEYYRNDFNFLAELLELLANKQQAINVLSAIKSLNPYVKYEQYRNEPPNSLATKENVLAAIQLARLEDRDVHEAVCAIHREICEEIYRQAASRNPHNTL